MKAAPRVSVFMFCRNRVHTIRRSVESVLAQTYPNIEYIIQDGASTDGTLEVLQEYDDPAHQSPIGIRRRPGGRVLAGAPTVPRRLRVRLFVGRGTVAWSHRRSGRGARGGPGRGGASRAMRT